MDFDKNYYLLESADKIDDQLCLFEGMANDLAASEKIPGVIGRVVGQFFVPNGKSRNGRWYGLDFWKYILETPEVQNDLAIGKMIGTIGHDLEFNENTFREGLISHKMTKLWISDDLRGMGEALILDTKVGHNLKTYLKSKVALYISSRAYGPYLKEKHDGLLMPDPKQYKLRGFDFVIEPGFLEAHHDIVENKNKTDKQLSNTETISSDNTQQSDREIITVSSKEDNSMPTSNEIRLANEANELRAQLDKALNDNMLLKNQLKASVSEADELKQYRELGSISAVKEAVDAAQMVSQDNPQTVPSTASNPPSTVAAVNPKDVSTSNSQTDTPPIVAPIDSNDKAELDKYRQLGTPEEIETALNRSLKFISDNKDKVYLDTYAEINNQSDIPYADVYKQYVSLGSPESIKKAITESTKFFQTYGYPEEISKVFNIVESFNRRYGGIGYVEKFFEENGSPDEISYALDQSREFFEEVGSPNEITESLNEAEEFFKENGSPEELKKILDYVEDHISDTEKAEADTISVVEAALGSKYGSKKDLKAIKNFFETYGTVNDISEAFHAMEQADKDIDINGTREFYDKVGTPEDIKEVFRRIDSFQENWGKLKQMDQFFKEYGSMNEIADVFKHISSGDLSLTKYGNTDKFFEEYGSPDELKKVVNDVQDFVDEVGTLDDVRKVMKSVDDFTAENGTFDEISQALDAASSTLKDISATEGFSAYNDFVKRVGSLSEAEKALDQATSLIDKYKELGSPEEINTALTKIEEFIDEVGPLTEVTDLVKSVNDFTAENGTFDEISTALDAANETISTLKKDVDEKDRDYLKFVNVVGTFEDAENALDQATELINKYKSLGTPEEIKNIFDKVNDFVDEVGSLEDARNVIDKVDEFVKENGSFTEIKNTLDDADNMIADFNEKFMDFKSPYQTFIREVGPLDEVSAAIDEANSMLDKYSKLGTPDEIRSTLLDVQDFVDDIGSFSDIRKVLHSVDEFINENGSFKEIADTLDQADQIVQSYADKFESQESEYQHFIRNVGSLSEAEDALAQATDLLDKYKKIGTPDEIELALKKASEIVGSYQDILDKNPTETKEEVNKMREELEKYRKIGTIPELEASIAQLDTILVDNEKRDQERTAADLATKYGINIEDVKEQMKTIKDPSVLDNILEGLSSSMSVAKIYSRNSLNEDVDEQRSPITSSSRISNLFSRYNKF